MYNENNRIGLAVAKLSDGTVCDYYNKFKIRSDRTSANTMNLYNFRIILGLFDQVIDLQ